MSIQNILDRKGAEVFKIEPTATVRTGAQLMQVHSIAALVVKGADVIGGLISEREIVHAISQHGERALSMPDLAKISGSSRSLDLRDRRVRGRRRAGQTSPCWQHSRPRRGLRLAIPERPDLLAATLGR
jgi:CBS domain-containing protein